LLHDKVLLSTVDGWVAGLRGEAFTSLLPLLRRTFSTFSPPERRRIGEWVKHGQADRTRPAAYRGAPDNFDVARAEAVLPLLALLLGLEDESESVANNESMEQGVEEP
jgi:hypothetical protein